jgi:hypothetical protein
MYLVLVEMAAACRANAELQTAMERALVLDQLAMRHPIG